MFGFFKSQESKMRENAANWVELAEKVYHYRRDVLPAAEVADLQGQTAGLRTLLKEKAGAEKLKLAIERLEEVLRRTGGAIYPKTALVENVEFFLVAAIVILGIRTYFVQPFKIPTNSMWPTYNGMTAEIWKADDKAPGFVEKVARFAAFGAQRREMIAPDSGRVTIPWHRGSNRIYFETKSDRKWLVIPTKVREYTFYVNGSPTRLRVPLDFDFDLTFQQATGLSTIQLARAAATAAGAGLNEVQEVALDLGAQRGKPILSFDIITGDQLFVDRVTYHFFPPKVGQGFVFRTDHIHHPTMLDPQTGEQVEQYYIKRLVGVPGDKLEIKQPVLYRNGAPIAGSDAFSANANREGKYRGYVNYGLLSAGEVLTIPEAKYFAMGDNSMNSLDGRFWGFVPAKDVVGRPLFVYFPFTRHWGPAR